VDFLTKDPLVLALHELQSPLGLIATAARAAAEDCADDEVRRRCEVILRAAERTLRSAQEILTLTRTEQGEPTEFDPWAMVRSVVTDIQEIGIGARLRITDSDVRPRAYAVAAHYESLIASCLSNALDHSHQGSVIDVEANTGLGWFAVRISNRTSQVRRHCGFGLGTYIADALARKLPAEIARAASGDRYTVSVRIAVG
jgi:signal transduction histidine kinase